jgi:hypothetical protein
MSRCLSSGQFQQLAKDLGDSISEIMSPKALRAVREDLAKATTEDKQRDIYRTTLLRLQVTTLDKMSKQLAKLVQQGEFTMSNEDIVKEIERLRKLRETAVREGKSDVAAGLEKQLGVYTSALKERSESLKNLPQAEAMRLLTPEAFDRVQRGMEKNLEAAEGIRGFLGRLLYKTYGQPDVETATKRQVVSPLDIPVKLLAPVLSLYVGSKFASTFLKSSTFDEQRDLLASIDKAEQWQRDVMLTQSKFLQNIAQNTESLKSYSPVSAIGTGDPRGSVGSWFITALGGGIGYAVSKALTSSLKGQIAGTIAGLVVSRILNSIRVAWTGGEPVAFTQEQARRRVRDRYPHMVEELEGLGGLAPYGAAALTVGTAIAARRISARTPVRVPRIQPEAWKGVGSTIFDDLLIGIKSIPKAIADKLGSIKGIVSKGILASIGAWLVSLTTGVEGALVGAQVGQGAVESLGVGKNTF